MNLDTDIAGIKLKNPVIMASGTFGLDYARLTDPARLGAVIPKSVTFEARSGNPAPRVWETTAGMLNSIGLENRGVTYFVEEELPLWLSLGATVIASIAGETIEEFVRVAEVLSEVEGISGLEINVSCPNVDRGGIQFGCRPRLAADVTTAVKNIANKPVIVKLTPNVTSVTEVAKAVEAAGADAVSLINTVLGLAIDIAAEKPALGRVVGGLSGPAIKPIALRLVYEAAGAVDIPVIGLGGITTSSDAIEFMLAGAAAIQIGTATFVEPKTGEKVVAGIDAYLREHNYDNVTQLIGKARL